MNKFDILLARTPPSDDAWHCPWFRLIEFFAANGAFFGALAYILDGAVLGLLAAGLGIFSGGLCLGSRSRSETTC